VAKGNRSHNWKHGKTKTPEYQAWIDMRRRCLEEDHPAARNYYARGIRVCDRYRTSFIDFLADVGSRPSGDLSIDRINNDKHYSCGRCPECASNAWTFNLRWATLPEQAGNKRNNVLLSCRGETKILEEWSRATGLSGPLISFRLDSGWTIEDALFTPATSLVSIDLALLVRARESCHLTQVGLCRLAGLCPMTVHHIERGHYRPRKETLQKIIAALREAGLPRQLNQDLSVFLKSG